MFPVTAISRLVEAGLEVDVRELFDKLEAGGNPVSDRQFASSYLDDPR